MLKILSRPAGHLCPLQITSVPLSIGHVSREQMYGLPSFPTFPVWVRECLCLCISMCLYVSVCRYVSMWLCVSMCLCVYVWMCLYVSIMFRYECASVCVCVSILMCICVSMCVYVDACLWIMYLCFFVCESLCVFDVCLCIKLRVSMYIFASAYLCMCIFVCLYVWCCYWGFSFILPQFKGWFDLFGSLARIVPLCCTIFALARKN